MSDVVVLSLDRIPPYDGPHAIPGIRFRPARAALGVTAWGMNVLELDPGCTGYPEHDHAADGQEEVYVVLSGSAVLHAGGVAHPLATGTLVRVPPDVRRTFTTDGGVTLLAIGGTPGRAYGPAPGM